MNEPPRIGRYRVQGRLGEGAEGVVHAVTGDDGRRLALKRLRADHPRESDIKREFRIVADLSHKNLVLPYSLEADELGPFVTMELVDGVPFTAWVRAADPDARALRLRHGLLQLCAGLTALHRRGLVHRDVKPSNVLVDGSGRVAILDFGLTQEALRGDEGFSGTPAYAAPEVLWGQPASAASDAYAVGVLAHEAVTGALPFHAEPDRSIAKRLGNPAPVLEGLPSDLAVVCRGLLEPDPTARLGLEDVTRALDLEGRTRSLANPPLELVGRAQELAELTEAWHTARVGRAPVVARVHGHSGMGKSALLRAFIRSLPSEVWVLESRSYERDTMAYKTIDAAMDALERRVRARTLEAGELLAPARAAHLATAFPSLAEALGAAPLDPGDDEPKERRHRAATALAELFRRVGEAHGLVLVLDDLQWGDVDSARMLVDVIESRPAGCLFVLAHRAGARDAPFLQELDRLAPPFPLVEIEVAPLTDQSARELAGAWAGDDDALADRVAAQAGGCPFLVEMLLSLGVNDAGGLERAFGALVESLPGNARALLETICVASKPLPPHRIPAALAPRGAAWLAWVALTQARLGKSTGYGGASAIEPYHDRIREMVAASLDVEARRAIHRALGEAFAREPTDLEGAATHLALAGERARAVPFARRAARAAREALAFDRAVRFDELALSCLDDDDPTRREVQLDLASHLADAGRGKEAAELYERLASGGTDLVSMDLRRRAMEHYLVAGALDEGSVVMRSLLADLGVSLPTRSAYIQAMLAVEVARLLLRGPRLGPARSPVLREKLEIETFASIGKGMSAFDANLGTWFFLRAARRALATGDYDAALRGVAYTASTFGFIASDFALRRAEQWIRAGEREAALRGDAHGHAVCGVARGMVACCSGAWRASLAEFDRAALALSGRTASLWESKLARTGSLLMLHNLGELSELRRRAREMSIDGDAHGDLGMSVEAGLYLAVGALADDDVVAAHATIDRYLARWTFDGYLFQNWIALRFRTHARLYAGDGAAAIGGIDAELPRARAANLTSMQLVRIEATDLSGRSAVAAAARASGSERADLLRRAERDAAALSKEGCEHAHAPAAAILGSVAALADRRADAVRLLAEAQRHYETADMPLHARALAWRLAVVRADDAARAAHEAAMRAFGVERPEAWARMLAPIDGSR